MNFLLHCRKPRRFHHEMIYSDERRERLARMEERARKELGMKEGEAAEAPFRPIRFGTERQRKFRRHEGCLFSGSGLTVLFLILFTLALLMIL